jgi:hypothetical protein
MKGAIKTLFFFSMLIAASAHAKVYMCKDAAGHTLTSDRPIPECADRAVREYSSNGAVKKDIAAPLTTEQKRVLELQQQKKKVEQAAADERKRSDRALSARYRSEDDIVSARKRDTELVNEQIAQQKRTLSDAEKELGVTQIAVAAQKQKGGVSAALQAKLGRAEQDVRELKKSVQDSELELAQVNEKYDLTLRRYREITQTASSR